MGSKRLLRKQSAHIKAADRVSQKSSKHKAEFKKAADISIKFKNKRKEAGKRSMKEGTMGRRRLSRVLGSKMNRERKAGSNMPSKSTEKTVAKIRHKGETAREKK